MSRYILFAACILSGVAAMAQEPPAPPVPRQGRISFSSQLRNGQRITRMETPTEKIEIEETATGKDIVLRREHKVNGEIKQDEFKAPDFDTLKKQHPDAAEAYQRATQRNQPQIIRPVPNIVPQFGFAPVQQPGPGQGTRRITATVKGQRVKISDQYGTRIEIAVTRNRDGEDDTETYSAADFAMLKREQPGIAAVYQRLTGAN